MRLVILGSGNWGLTLALVFSQRRKVLLWAKDKQEIKKAYKVLGSCPDYNPKRLIVKVKYSLSLSEDDILVVAVPSGIIRQVGKDIAEFLQGKPLTVVSVSKGLAQPGFKTMSQVLLEELPQCQLGIISGPTIASEVAQNKPAKAVLAAYDVQCLMRLKEAFRNQVMSFELSLKVKELEFCASLKGIIAVGAGIAEGLNLGKNFLGLLLTYGLHEFLAIGRFLDISTQQVLSIAGLGDLIATCWSPDSRNYHFGCLLAKKIHRDKALKRVGMVVEGVRMAEDIAKLASLNVRVPIVCAIAKVINSPTDNSLNKFIKTVLEYREAI